MLGARPLEKKRIILQGGTHRVEDGEREPLHVHDDHAQLKWPSTGLAAVQTPSGVFVVPPCCAVWIPAGQRHGGLYFGAVVERNLYIGVEHCAELPRASCVIGMSPALIAIVEAASQGSTYSTESSLAEHEATVASLSAELRDTGLPALKLTLPTRSKVQPVIDHLLANPTDRRSHHEWARRLELSPRTFTRLFHQETALSFGTWRKRARAFHALQRLAVASDTSGIATELGYASDSAFIYMFRTTLGITPSRYLERLRTRP